MPTPEAKPPASTEPVESNIWLVLMYVGAAITLLAAVLEIVGVWHDLGLGVGFLGLMITTLSAGVGARGATQASIRRLDHRLDQMHDTLLHILNILDRRLPDQK